MCMWLTHVVTFSPLKGLPPRSESISSFLCPSKVQERQSLSATGSGTLLGGTLTHREWGTCTEIEPTCSAQQNLPRTGPGDQPQDHSALHGLARAAPTEAPDSIVIRKGSPSGVRLAATLAHSGLEQPKGCFLFHSAPSTLLHLLHRRLLSISRWRTASLLISGPSQAIPVGTQQGFRGRKQ